MRLSGLQGVSFDNKIFMIGGKLDGDSTKPSNSIISFNTTTEQWEHIGYMSEKRHSHGVSVVPAKDIIDHCSA